jgi:hypothetical protein
MKNVLISVALVAFGFALAACSPAQVSQIQAKNAQIVSQVATVTAVACQVDGQVQPVVVALAAPVVSAVVPGSAVAVAGTVAVDQTVVHPAIVAACAAVGGAAVSLVPAAPAAK